MPSLTEEAKAALRHMWSQQTADGSDYWGTSLAAVAGMSDGSDAHAPAGASAKLRAYLRAGLSGYLNLHNRLALLWASSAWDELLSDAEQQRLIDQVFDRQQADGGFRLVDLGSWPSRDAIPPGEASDGYATAFTTFVLQRLETPRAAKAIAGGLAWLGSHQKADGRWETLSPNKDRSQDEALTRLFLSDAATGFAVLALTATTHAP